MLAWAPRPGSSVRGHVSRGAAGDPGGSPGCLLNSFSALVSPADTAVALGLLPPVPVKTCVLCRRTVALGVVPTLRRRQALQVSSFCGGGQGEEEESRRLCAS